MIPYTEVVKIIQLDPIPMADDEEWLFRIEILRHSQKGYFAQLWRQDSYDIKPTFAIKPDWIASETLFVQENYRLEMSYKPHYFVDVESCLSAILTELAKQFDLSE